MPRTNDPLGILTGAGFAPPGSVSSSSIAPGEVGPASESLDAHVDNPTGAHPASAISILDPYTRYFMGPNVEGALNELAALVPPPMGGVGSEGVAWLGSSNVGTPDWGILKLWDGILPFTGNSAANPRAVYPYYYRAPVTASGYGLTGAGVDAATDPTFNVLDGVYTGGGDGTTHAGFVTLTMGAGAAGYPTWRMLTAIVNPAAVVSGIVSPADRGVLALVKWPTGTEPDPAPAATVANIQARCVAAILLGKGILDNGCDGEPGGAFSEATAGGRAAATVVYNANPAAGYFFTLDLSSVGGPPAPVTFTAVVGPPANPYEFTVGGVVAATANNLALALNTLYFSEVFAAISNGVGTVDIYLRAAGTVGNAPTTTITCTALPADITITNFAGGTDAVSSPFTFPGRAAGQYNLDEIHAGSSSTGGLDPFYNPAAGQVRLLTDPAAVTFAAPKTVAGGLPIFGATTNAIGTTTPVVGFPFSIGGGTTGNFFAYRLPYLKDYSVATGLIYTPALEKPRFTTKLAPASLGALTQAGDYDDFTADFWAYQIGRYRHRFVLATGAAATRTDDSYALVHFKKEAYFEAYVRDGVVPTSDQLWSVNLVQWTGNTPPYDLVENLVTGTPSASTANPVNRSEVFEDNNGTVIPVPTGLSFTLGTAAVPTTMFCSGIEYYVPVDVTTVNTPNIAITALAFSYNGLFDRGYRSHDTVPGAGPLAADDRRYALNQNPVFVSLASFSYEGTEAVPPTSTIVTGSPGAVTFPAELGEIRRQRIEFGYADLTPATTVDPAVGDVASYAFSVSPYANGIYFTGDPNTPVFTTDAKVRVFLRRPMVVDPVTGYPEPIAGTTIPNISGDTILYHSMQEGTTTGKVPYGNPSTSGALGLTNTKDRDERFLDEVYRYPENWTPLGVPADVTQLQGPGLPFGPAPISVPVRPVVGGGYDGWYLLNLHLSQLDNATANLDNALQVAGLPPRDPSYKEGLTSPAPSRGVLVYPQTDYSTGYAPAQAAAGASDYSALTGDRVYIRAFDAGAANAGTSTVTFRLWGVGITNFQYAALTAPGATGMAVMVKVPGLTTWMDAGRTDGTGPSKQDIALDGAGCLVTSATGTDTVSQIFYTDITVNLSPAALFINGEGKCPVLVKVILKDNPTGKALNFANVAETFATNLCRGLVGIEINP